MGNNRTLMIVIGALMAGAIAFLFMPVAGVRETQRRHSLGKQVRVKKDTEDDTPDEKLTREQRRAKIQKALKRAGGGDEGEEKVISLANMSLEDRLAAADIKIPKEQYLMLMAAVSAVLPLVWFVATGKILLPILLFALLFWILPSWYVKRAMKKRQQAFLRQLPEALDFIARGMKSGLPLQESFRALTGEMGDPLKTEFVLALQAQNFGLSFKEAMATMARRMPLPEVIFFVAAVSIQADSGGNLSEALNNISNILRARWELMSKVQRMSKDGKTQAWIIGLLPVAIMSLMYFAQPEFISRLFTTFAGNIILAIAVVLFSVGMFWTNNITKIEI
jgi:tight adherence protein B